MIKKKIKIDEYYRAEAFKRFTLQCKCSTSITTKLNVTKLYIYSKITNTKFYINFLFILSKVLNSRDDYKMKYDYNTKELLIYDVINPCHFIYHDDTETTTMVYTKYNANYQEFYMACLENINKAKETRDFGIDYSLDKENYFEASYIPWVSYESLNIELPDGYLFLLPIINWAKYEEYNGEYKMNVTVRMNHAIADGYLISKVFKLLEEEIDKLID